MKTQKRFRIESDRSTAMDDGSASDRHAEIMDALSSLKESVAPSQVVSRSLLEESRRDMQEALRLRSELELISASIQRTKQEIVTLHYAGAQGQEIASATDELGAVVLGTETATHTILEAAEKIDELASNLAARLAGGDRDIAKEISDQVISVFEACNFQDITGQRISKVVASMRFVEERVTEMIKIWGGIESFKDIERLQGANANGEQSLLNGPALDHDPGRTSQDNIDAMFN
ncbi:protein phosphatase CheZ [Microvirga brassicacearum]|uniref:Protein phosphatase CheZ n=1 Tax=Microvirga brassicacearum TaxID=2580413 RepID=A0A5N3P3J6_9HYPH|nr:protein phosphatase CheZ [Microvirga brassicacearum]